MWEIALPMALDLEAEEDMAVSFQQEVAVGCDGISRKQLMVDLEQRE